MSEELAPSERNEPGAQPGKKTSDDGGTSRHRGSAEFRTVRRALYALYLAFVFLFCGWVTVSILLTLFGRRPGDRTPTLGSPLPHQTTDLEDPATLEACTGQLSSLLSGLVDAFVEVQRNPGADRAWVGHSREWTRSWRSAQTRCHLDEADAARRPAIRQLSRIHAELGALHDSYTGLIGRLANEQTPRVRRLRGWIDEVEREARARRNPPAR
jgi:hypothetical protein